MTAPENPWRCWSCHRPVRPLTKCQCGWMVAVHRTDLTDPPNPRMAIDYMADNRSALERYLTANRSMWQGILRAIWRRR